MQQMKFMTTESIVYKYFLMKPNLRRFTEKLDLEIDHQVAMLAIEICGPILILFCLIMKGVRG